MLWNKQIKDKEAWQQTSTYVAVDVQTLRVTYVILISFRSVLSTSGMVWLQLS